MGQISVQIPGQISMQFNRSWGRISDIANSQAGFAFKSSAFNDARIGLPLIRIRDVGSSDPTTFFDGPYRDEFVVTKGDFLVSMDGQFRVAVWKGPKALLNQRVSRLQFYSSEAAQNFFAISLHIRLAELQGVKAYTTVDHLSGGQILAAVVGVPPLAEQHRIVAKVDELMALCDRLEAEQKDAEAAHAKLVETLLGTLTQSTDTAELATNWQRLAEHFDTLFTTEASLDALKQTILRLAVMGRLVQQDPNDDPTNRLLNQIGIERERLEKQGLIKRTKLIPPVGENDLSFALPNQWMIIRLGSVIDLVSGQHLAPDEYSDDLSAPIPYLTGPAEFGEIYPEPTRSTAQTRAIAIAGDILITVKGSGVGKLNLVSQPALAISRQLMAIRPIILNAAFVELVLKSAAQHFQEQSVGIAIPGIGRDDVQLLPIALPPLAEQHRIVAKVDELMALIDRLKAGLAESSTRQAQLAGTLIKTALKAA